MLRFLALQDVGASFDPFTKQLSTHVAGSNAHAAAVADALGFARIARAVYVQLFWSLRRLFRKPYWRLDALPIFAKRFEIDVLVSLQRRKSRIRHKFSR